MKTSKYNFYYRMNDKEWIIYNTRTLGLSIITNNELEEIKHIEANDRLAHKNNELQQELFKSGFLVEDECNELKIIKNRLNKNRYSENALNITIAPTLECNFKCAYCYECKGEEKSSKKMTLDIEKNVIEFVRKKLKKCKRMTVVWYGGEPMLAFDTIDRVSNIFMEMCRENGVMYEASMITNGYLLDKITVKDLKKIKINSLQITLDGSKKIHDSKRMLKNDKGTYDKIIANLKEIQPDIQCTIRHNIDKKNYKYVEKFLSDLSKEHLENVEVYFAPVTNYEDINDPMCFTEQEFADIWWKCYKIASEKNLCRKGIMIPPCSFYCDADYVNGFVIDAEGYVYKCWQDIGVKCKSCGNVGRVSQNYSQLYYEYMTYDATSDSKCKECKILPICMGGCPFDRVNGNQHCSRYKYILEHVVRNMVGENEHD